MADEILLNYLVDQPYVPISNVETQIKSLIKIKASPSLKAQVLQAHICLVLDVSASMRDAEMREVIRAASRAVDRLRPGDILSLIAFQSNVYNVIEAEEIRPDTDRLEIKHKIQLIQNYRGGGTNMEDALMEAGFLMLQSGHPSMSRRILLFTDGQVDGVESKTLRQAEKLSQKGIVIDALGFGPNFDYQFMQKLVSFSNGTTEKIDRPEEIGKIFDERIQSATNTIATNVQLNLNFTADVRANRGYVYSPSIRYLGNIRLPGNVRDIDIFIGDIEKDVEYSYVITFTVPSRPRGPMRAVEATLYYDIPALKIKNRAISKSIVVEFSDDPEETAIINGEVEQAFDQVEIGRLVGELERFIKKDSHKKVSMFFDVLTKRYKELGNAQMAQHYQDMKRKYMEKGALSQEDMNYSRHQATQKLDIGVTLVDASDFF